jgi:23S rRNA (adenine1618-N6)-methyltransferase
MVVGGGEVGFVIRMIEESVQLTTKVQWYSSMLGKLASVSSLIPVLQRNGIDNYAVTEFIQGNKTRRWALAWSHGPMRPRSVSQTGLEFEYHKRC